MVEGREIVLLIKMNDVLKVGKDYGKNFVERWSHFLVWKVEWAVGFDSNFILIPTLSLQSPIQSILNSFFLLSLSLFFFSFFFKQKEKEKDRSTHTFAWFFSLQKKKKKKLQIPNQSIDLVAPLEWQQLSSITLVWKKKYNTNYLHYLL